MSTLDALLAAVALKHQPRAGWLRTGLVHAPRAVESVAAHSWGVAYLVLALLPPELDRAKALTFAVLHDLPEALTGDITPHDGISRSEKHAREDAACQTLTAPMGPNLYTTWQQYERQQCAESQFVKQLDKLDMALQALHYTEEHGVDTREFMASAAAGITHPVLVDLMDAIADRASPEGPPQRTAHPESDGDHGQ